MQSPRLGPPPVPPRRETCSPPLAALTAAPYPVPPLLKRAPPRLAEDVAAGVTRGRYGYWLADAGGSEPGRLLAVPGPPGPDGRPGRLPGRQPPAVQQPPDRPGPAQPADPP